MLLSAARDPVHISESLGGDYTLSQWISVRELDESLMCVQIQQIKHC